jgi:hypothetical protein
VSSVDLRSSIVARAKKRSSRSRASCTAPRVSAAGAGSATPRARTASPTRS